MHGNNDNQLAKISKEVTEIAPQVDDLWKLIRKKTVEINRIGEDDADAFLQDLFMKPGYGIEWLHDNFSVVEKLREIFNEHPCLNHIAIIKPSMNIHIDKD